MDHKLIYVNKLGFNYKGHHVYEFIFTDTTFRLDDVWGEGWEQIPAHSNAQPPDIDYIKKVGSLESKDFELEVAHDSLFFKFEDATQGVLALGWEEIPDEFDGVRLVFAFGESKDSVDKKLKTRNLSLVYED